MACFHPLVAWQLDSGDIVFKERGKIRRELTLPCGRCIGCRQVRVRSWAIRCLHEAKMHDKNSFVTLTYEGDCDPSLNYVDFQRFMYRLRRRLGPTRFYMCGEYGGLNFRPHFHALLFGRGFSDCAQVGENLYRSRTLESLWPHGFSSVGDVTYQSAAYVASYALKKANGDLADRRYSRVCPDTGEIYKVTPEFGHMSLKPGIGYSWFVKYYKDVFAARDGVVHNGRVVPAPRYYMDCLESIDENLHIDKVVSRYVNSGRFSHDNTPERLATRELIAHHNLARKRSKYL